MNTSDNDSIYRVFISSTSQDLKEYRQLAKDACIDAKMFPIMMENFVPEDANALQKCYDELRQADVLVGIYAHRYGYAPTSSVTYTDEKGNLRTGDGVTGITEWEYLWAKEMGMPIIILMIDPDADWKVSLIEHEKKAQLDAFKKKIGIELVYKSFTDKHDFHVKIVSILKDSKTQARVNAYAFGKLPTPEQIKERERHAFISGSQPPPSPIKEKIRRIGSLPKVFTSETFFDRANQQAQVSNAIHNHKALIGVYGRGGVGKTALMCKVLGDFENHTPPADGLAYFRADKTPILTAGELFEALAKFLPDDHPFHDTRKEIALSVADKTRALIEALHGGRYILYIDNLESLQFVTPQSSIPHEMGGGDKTQAHPITPQSSIPPLHEMGGGDKTQAHPISPQSSIPPLHEMGRGLGGGDKTQAPTLSPVEGHITEPSIREFLATVLSLGDNRGLSVVITSRVPLRFGANPLFFDTLNSGYHEPIRLDDGLPSDEGIAFMQSIDKNGSLPKDKAQLAQWHTKVEGFPRGLEALVGYLNESETRSVQDLLDDPALFGNNVLDKIVGKVIATLPSALQRVLCAVSVIGQTATQADLEYALAPHVDTAHLRHALDWLVAGRYLAYNAQTRAYSLHPLDVAYITSTLLPHGDKPIQGWRGLRVADETAFTRYALTYRMAELYHQKAEKNKQWESIADLEAHLREMEYRMVLGDYDTVASILLKMDFDYLLLWGHTELVLDWHTRLDGQVKNPSLAMQCIGNLGMAYWMMGNAEKAITYYQKALDMTRAQKHREGEGVWLGNLGSAYLNLGEIERAIGYYEDALVIAREIKDRKGEGNRLGNLGLAYADLGEIERAIGYYEDALVINREAKDKRSEGNQLGNLGSAYLNLGEIERAIGYYNDALVIAREIKDKRSEGIDLGNLGIAYRNLGEIERAIGYYEDALVIAREIKDRKGEGIRLGNLGSAKTLLGRYAEAIPHLHESIEIVTAINAPHLIQDKNAALATAYWYAGSLTDALATIRQARTYDIIANNHAVAGLHGCIALCAGHADEAKRAFEEALTHADALLAKTANQYGALYSRGLALAGLWMVTGDADYRARATSAYADAMAVNRGAGVLLENRQKLEAVARCAGADVVGWLG